jgi:hypothetical protein
MKYLKWLGLLAAVFLIASCFFPWVLIPSKSITITGIQSEGTNFGKPGYFNLLMTGLYILFALTPRVWAKRANLIVVALNMAWSLRNYFMVTACEGGECPDTQPALYILLISSIIMFLSALFPDTKLKA